MKETVFSKIIDQEIPAEIVYEDELVLCFLDVHPVNKGHMLIVPKVAFENIFDGDPETLGHMMKVGQKMALLLKASVNADGVNIIMNNGAAADQEVFHSHLHIIPRFENDKSFSPPQHVAYGDGEASALATQLRTQLDQE